MTTVARSWGDHRVTGAELTEGETWECLRCGLGFAAYVEGSELLRAAATAPTIFANFECREDTEQKNQRLPETLLPDGTVRIGGEREDG